VELDAIKLIRNMYVKFEKKFVRREKSSLITRLIE
jgi:hypothetical protein